MLRAALLLGLALAALLLLGHASAAPGLENPTLLEDRGPIRIDRDADFDAAHGVRSGNGTAEDPYVIAHWRIRGPEVLVRIANTTKPFVVRNLDLEGTCVTPPCLLEAGMHLDTVRGGLVLHNRVAQMDRAALSLEEAQLTEVVENLVEGGGSVSTSAAVLVDKSQGVELRGNLVRDAGPPRGSPAATASVRVRASNDTLVADNTITGGTEAGLSLLLARRAVVVDNVLSRNDIGIASQGLDAFVGYNTITENARIGVLVTHGSLRLERNDLALTSRMVEVVGQANVTMRGNNLVQSPEYALRLTGNATADAIENWWGDASGPDVNGTGPGRGGRVALLGANASQARVVPFLAERVAVSGAHAPRAEALVVSVAPRAPGSDPAQDPSPVAVLEGPGQAYVGIEASFSGARSLDPQGEPLRFAWDFGDGEGASGSRARHTFRATGEYVVRLTATDPTGLASRASVLVNVTRQPLGVALLVNATAPRGADVQAQAVVTGQPQGEVRFRFTADGPGTFTGEPLATNRTVLRFDAPGDAIVGVEARDAERTVTTFERVLVLNQAPVAHITVSPEQGDTRTEFRFAALGSKDADADELSYAWDVEGQRTMGPELTKRFPVAGRHVVALTASDGFAAHTTELVVDVAPAPAADERPVPGLPAALLLLALAGASRGARRRGR